jgi:hypothetical protein
MQALDGGNIRLLTSVINGIETSSIDTSGELLTDQVNRSINTGAEVIHK